MNLLTPAAFPHRAVVRRRARKLDSLGGSSDGFAVVYSNLPCWVQLASEREITEYQKRGFSVTDRIYLLSDYAIEEEHIIEVDGNVYEVRSRAIPDASAGKSAVWRIMAERTSTGSTYPSYVVLEEDLDSSSSSSSVSSLSASSTSSSTSSLSSSSWSSQSSTSSSSVSSTSSSSVSSTSSSSSSSSSSSGDTIRWLSVQSPGALYIYDEQATTDALNLSGSAAEFDGGNDYGYVADFLSGGAALSVCVWMYTATTGPDCMIAHWDDNSQRSWKIATASGSDELEVWVSADGGNTNIKQYVTSGLVSASTWTHVAFTFAADDLILYIDGQAVAVTKSTDATVNSLHDSTANVTVGVSLSSGSGAEFWSGRLFDARIYTETLTPTQILNIYNSTNGAGNSPGSYLYPTNLEAHWRLDDKDTGSGVFLDTSGNGRHLTQSGGVTASYDGSDVPCSFYNELGYTASGYLPARSDNTALDTSGGAVDYPGPLAKRAQLKTSPCGTFDGINDYAESSDFLSGGAALTVSARIKTSNTASLQTIVAHRGASSTNTSWYLSTANPSGYLRVIISSDGATSTTHKLYESTVSVADGNWHQVSFTFAANSLKLYIDGVEVAVTKTADNTVNSLFNCTVPVSLSAFQAVPPAYSYWYTGQLADVRIYESTLSAADVLTIYQGGTISATPKAHWPCSENDGTIFYDVSGNGYHMTSSGATSAQLWANTQDVYHGAMRKGFRCLKRRRTFNGSSQYLSLASGSESAFRSGTTGQANHTDMWVAAWIVPDTISGSHGIVAKYDSVAGRKEWFLYQSSANIQLFVSGDGTTTTGVSGTVPAVAGVPMFTICYHDATADVIKISINGGAFAQNTHTTGIWATSYPFIVGGLYNSGTAGTFFSGNIRLAAVGKPPSNPADWTVLRDLLWNNGAVPSYDEVSAANHTTWGTVDWFDMDGNGNLEVGRHAGTQLTGTNMTNDRKPQVITLETTPTKEYQTFDGSTHAYQRDSNATLQTGDIDFWVSLWFKMPDSKSRGLCGKTSNPNYEWFVYTSSGGTSILIQVWDGSTFGFKSQSIANDGVLHHVLFYHDSTNNVLASTLDGGSVATTAHSSGIASSSYPFRIGYGLSRFMYGNIFSICVGKPPSNPADWTVLRDLLYNSGTPFTYADWTSGDKTTWGLVSHWDMEDEGTGILLDSHGTNHMQGTSIPSATTHASGTHNNQGATTIDFTHGIAAPWTAAFSVPTTYEFGDTLPNEMTKITVDGGLFEKRYNY